MSFDKFKKIKNPYTTTIDVDDDIRPVERFEKLYKSSNPEPKEFVLDKGLLDGPHKHLVTKYCELEREVKILKEDLASLYLMLLGDDLPETMTLEEIREQYFKFRLDKRHLSNKKPQIVNE